MSLEDKLTGALTGETRKEQVEISKPAPPPSKPKERFARPGEAESSHRKPLPRGEPFSDKNSLVNWSTR